MTKSKEEGVKSVVLRDASGKEIAEAGIRGLDFDMIYAKASEYFKELAGFDGEDVTITSLEVSKRKADNFLSSMSGLLEIAHQVEVLSAERDKFRRKDELDVLNSLRRACAKASNSLEQTMGMAEDRMEMLRANPEGVDPESIALLQSVLHQSIDTAQKLISAFSRLVQLERMSGGRPFGAVKAATMSSMNLIQGLSEADQQNKMTGFAKSGGKVSVRALSEEEYEDLE
jgi:hypothetical protein